MRCATGSPGTIQTGGTFPVILPDYTAPSDQRKGKKSKQRKEKLKRKEEKGGNNHERPMQEKEDKENERERETPHRKKWFERKRD